MDDLFDLQDEITKKIVVSLQVELTHGEQARAYAKTTDNLEAWSYGVKANELLDRFNKEDNAKAQALLEAVIKLDPEYVLAYVWLGRAPLLSWFSLHIMVFQLCSFSAFFGEILLGTVKCCKILSNAVN